VSDLVIKELTPFLRDDLLLFFDHVAFAGNPDWSDCYCSAYHFANDKGKAEGTRQNSRLVGEDRMHGFLAYNDGKPVGWLTMVVGLLSCFSQWSRHLALVALSKQQTDLRIDRVLFKQFQQLRALENLRLAIQGL